MMIHKLLSLAIFAASLFSASLLSGFEDRYEALLVERIEIILENAPPHAARNIESIRSRMKTSEGQYFSQISFDCDLKALSQDFAEILPCFEIVQDKLLITLRIELKPTIRSLQWRGNRAFSAGRLQQELGVKTGIVFDRLAFNRAFQQLKIHYVKSGYYEACLSYTVEKDEEANEVDLIIDIAEGRCGKIEEVAFHGVSRSEERALKRLLLTKPFRFLTSWFHETGIYNEEMILQDKYIVLNFLYNWGYADASVEVEVVESEKPDRIEVHFFIEKGERYFIGEISFEGNTLYSEEELRNALCLCEGDRYSPEAVHEAVSKLTELYGCKGYIDALVDYEPLLDESCPLYALKFHIEEGEPYRVGLIKIFGNCVTNNSVILHESLMVPGELFNLQKLKASEARLANIGYFKSVNVYAVRSDNPCLEEANYRDIHIEVEETSTGNFNAFFGLSSVETIFGGFSVTEKNFNYRGLRRLFREGYSALRGGGEYLHYSTNIGSQSRKYSLSWAKPYFNDTPWIIGFDLERSNVRYVSDDYETNAWAFNTHAKYPINPYLRFGWHYRLRNTDMHAIKPNPAIRKDARNDGITSASGISLQYDSTDHPIFPTCGRRSAGLLEFAGIGGDFHFWSVAYNNALYLPLPQKGVIKLRADLRFITPLGGTTYDTMPIDERFFLGGFDNVRGYKDFEIGPKYPNSNAPRGGISLSLFSAEYTWRPSKSWEPFVFFDAGNVSKKHWKVENLKTSAGFGTRLYLLPGGAPITLGLGFPINKGKEDATRNFFFSMGGTF